MNPRMKMVRAIALETDSEDFYARANAFGEQAAKALGPAKRAQITGLESIANSSQKVSDVFDYLKLRTARQKEWQLHDLGKNLLKYLETDLSQKRKNLCKDPDLVSLNEFQQQEVYMLLIRAFVAHLAAQYEFACMEGK